MHSKKVVWSVFRRLSTFSEGPKERYFSVPWGSYLSLAKPFFAQEEFLARRLDVT